MANYFAAGCTYTFNIFYTRAPSINWKPAYKQFFSDPARTCSNIFTCRDYYGTITNSELCTIGATNNLNPSTPTFRTFNTTNRTLSNGFIVNAGFYIMVSFSRANLLSSSAIVNGAFRYTGARIRNEVTGTDLILSASIISPVEIGGYPQRGFNLGTGPSASYNEYGDLCYIYDVILSNSYITNGNGFFPSNLREILTYGCQPCL
jgi:hypothetical protein